MSYIIRIDRKPAYTHEKTRWMRMISSSSGFLLVITGQPDRQPCGWKEKKN